MPRSPASDKLVATAEGIYAEIGKKLTIESSGGAADASLVAGVGVPVLDEEGLRAIVAGDTGAVDAAAAG